MDLESGEITRKTRISKHLIFYRCAIIITTDKILHSWILPVSDCHTQMVSVNSSERLITGLFSIYHYFGGCCYILTLISSLNSDLNKMAFHDYTKVSIVADDAASIETCFYSYILCDRRFNYIIYHREIIFEFAIFKIL